VCQNGGRGLSIQRYQPGRGTVLPSGTPTLPAVTRHGRPVRDSRSLAGLVQEFVQVALM
jgi:hypothetical protein